MLEFFCRNEPRFRLTSNGSQSVTQIFLSRNTIETIDSFAISGAGQRLETSVIFY